MAPPWELDDVEWQVELAKIIDEPYFGTLPDLQGDEKAGSEIMKEIQGKSVTEQRARIMEELKRGNIPDFLREPALITIDLPGGRTVTYYTMPEYLAVGTNEDYVIVPMSGSMAQEICREFSMVPPTAMMADHIHQLSQVQFNAGPDGLMKSWAVDGTDSPDKWLQHNEEIEKLKQQKGYVDGQIVSGHKKDIVMSDSIWQAAGPGKPSHNVANDKLGLYSPSYTQNERERAMEKQTGKDQPPMADAARHHPDYVDYSQGLRMVSPVVYVDSNDGNGPQPMHISEALSGKDADVLKALSGEGAMKNPVIFADR